MLILSTSTLFFLMLGAFSCGTCLLVIGVQNPMHSMLLLISVFFMGTLFLFMLQSEYFASLFLIVYVGAIVVLFLFIISSLELKSVNVASRLRDLFNYRYVMLAFFLLELLFLASQDFFDMNIFISDVAFPLNESITGFTEANAFMDWSKLMQHTDHLRALGGVLYTEYKISVLIMAVLLFLASVGALAVTLISNDQSVFSVSESPKMKMQDANYQASRHPLYNTAKVFYF